MGVKKISIFFRPYFRLSNRPRGWMNKPTLRYFLRGVTYPIEHFLHFYVDAKGVVSDWAYGKSGYGLYWCDTSDHSFMILRPVSDIEWSASLLSLRSETGTNPAGLSSITLPWSTNRNRDFHDIPENDVLLWTETYSRLDHIGIVERVRYDRNRVKNWSDAGYYFSVVARNILWKQLYRTVIKKNRFLLSDEVIATRSLADFVNVYAEHFLDNGIVGKHKEQEAVARIWNRGFVLFKTMDCWYISNGTVCRKLQEVM